MTGVLSSHLSANDKDDVEQASLLLSNAGYVQLLEHLMIVSFRWPESVYRREMYYAGPQTPTFPQPTLRVSTNFRPELWLSAAYAASAGLVAVLESLLKKGVDVNGFSGHYEPLLLYACGASNQFQGMVAAEPCEAAIELLLQSGADINLQGIGGRTALEWAYERSPSLARLLIEKGADVNGGRGLKSKPVLSQAASKRDLEFMIFALGHGADVNATPAACEGALCEAARQGDADIVRLLLTWGAEVNHSTESGITPLIAACKYGHRHVVDLLLDHDPDPSICGGNRVTALFTANS
jgi:ankyrin repeat protein